MSPIDPHRHLLDEAQATQIFETRIVPQELSLGTRQERPTVIFVGGQPGAGKTMSTEGQVRSLQSRGQPVVVNSDFYKPFHPQYARLLREDDRHAAAYTSADGRRWMAMAERWLISHGFDVVIETTMRDPGDFIEPARMFRDHSYRVEATILAVPAALSQLGILARYSQQIKITGHGRLTLPANQGVAQSRFCWSEAWSGLGLGEGVPGLVVRLLGVGVGALTAVLMTLCSGCEGSVVCWLGGSPGGCW